MAKWHDLPSELIYEALCYLNQPQILRVCFVSRFLLAIAEPLLYRNPDLTRGLSNGEGPAFFELRGFARQIISRPRFAPMVCNLKIVSIEDELYEVRPPSVFNGHCDAADVDRLCAIQTYAEREDLKVVMAAMAEEGIPNALVVDGSWLGEVVALLHHLPQLRSLSISGSNEVRLLTYAAMGKLVGGVPIGLRTISHLQLMYLTTTYRPDREAFGSDVVIPFMHLSNLRTFSVCQFGGNLVPDGLGGLDDEQPGGFNSALPPDSEIIRRGASSITDLHFVFSHVGSRLLNSLLTLPRRLKKFEYVISGLDIAAPPFTPSELVPGLHLHRHSLTHLTFSDDFFFGELFATNGVTIGSLSEFTSLTYLQIPLLMLLGHPQEGVELEMAIMDPIGPLLPPSLVHLELKLRDWPFKEFMLVTGYPDSWLRSRRRFQYLEHFVVHRNAGFEGRTGSDIKPALAAFPDMKEKFEAAKIIVKPE